MVDRLAGKVAIVTGAARGIGLGIATLMAQEGAAVVACDVIPSEGTFEFARSVHLDVTDEKAWIELVARTERDLGPISILVNNAGVTGPEFLHETSKEEWERVIGVNQTGVFLGMKSTLPSMLRGNGGSIVNISSIIGATAVPGIAAYHASKGAVRTLTKNVAVTYATDGVRANAILPGFIRTAMTSGQDDAVNSVFIDATPLRRIGDPIDIAWAAVFLASDESSFVTGIDLPVDGGYLAC